MSCYFRHMKDVLEEAGIDVTPKNKKRSTASFTSWWRLNTRTARQLGRRSRIGSRGTRPPAQNL